MAYCDELRITRCFFNGRGAGYPCIGLINALKCSNLLIKNCVSTFYWEAFHLTGCDNVVVENNVSFYNMIMIAAVGSSKGQTARFSKNIFIDSQPFKVGQPMLTIGQNGVFIDDDNCYYTRLPEKERKLFLFSGWDKKRGSIGRQNLDGYRKYFKATTSIVANPMLRATVGMKDDRKRGKYAPSIVTDRIAGRRNLDFNDFFTTNPKLIKRGIGLQPDAFKNFKVTHSPPRSGK